MNIKNKIFVFFMCILVLSACGNDQNIVDGDVNTIREGMEEQIGEETLFLPEPGSEIEGQIDPLPESQTKPETEAQTESQEGELGGQAYYPNRCPSTNDVDWEAYRKILSDEDYAALQGYFPVLTEGALFTWTDIARPDEDEVEEHTVTLAEFGHMLNDDPWLSSYGSSYGSDELWLDSLTLCDVDRDGNKELILCFENQWGIFLILKEENGTYYGTYTVFRGFEVLQTNGVYVGSDGAEDNYFLQMYFEDGVFYEIVLGRACYGHYKIGDEWTTDEEVFQEWLDSIMPGDMIYYKPQIKASDSQVEHISAHIHSEEEYQALISQLEGYSGYFSLDLYMEDSDIPVYLDDIISGRNLADLEIENGGRITARNVKILDTGSLRWLHLKRVLSVDKEVLRHVLVLDTIDIELDDNYEGAPPTEELLEDRVCPNLILSWSGSGKSDLIAEREVCGSMSEEWDAIAPMLESGNLMRICRRNAGDYSYTSFEFTGPDSEWDCCGALISVRDRESGGEKYFDMLEIPEERLGGIHIHNMRSQLIILEDANFDGYGDIIFASFYRYYTGTIFLWDQKKERYVLCESAPEAFEWIDPMKERLIYVETMGTDYEAYYIYEYNGSVFAEKKLELSFAKEDETGTSRYTWHYYEGGELLETLELVEGGNIAGNYLIYEGNGVTREEVLTQDKIYYKEIGKEYFPEFDFYLSG